MSQEREILDLIADAVLVTDDETAHVIETNAAAALLLGYARDELIGMSLEQLSAEPEASMKAFHERVQTIPVRRYRRKDGSIVPLEITTLYGRWNGRDAHIATYRDISAHVETERALRESEERLLTERNLLLTLINNLPDHIYLRDRENRFMLANRAVAEFMGAGDPALMVGKRDSDFYSPEIAAQFEADDRRILEEGKAVINQERCDRSADGKLRWTMTTKVPLFDGTGSVIGLVGISRDFTESRETKEALRRSEEQLQQGQKMEAVGRLAGGIAHDFNNLLTVIRGFADLIDARLARQDPSAGDVAEIRHASERAARLTAQLLAFGRKQMLQPRVVRLDEVIRPMRAMLPRIIGEDIELDLKLDETTGSIRADQGQIEQVIMNLSVNARDAMPQGGRLIIETGNRRVDSSGVKDHPEVAPGEYVVLVVSDTGDGMDAATVSRIFEPFFTTKEKGRGTGLGLATVYGIVTQSEGRVFCDSIPGSGTAFTIYFPRVFEAPAERETIRPARGSLAGTETVLLVEDEDSLRSFLRSILERHGYTVIDARDGSTALEIFTRGDRFDVLVTDIVMPRLGGQELAQRVLRTRPDARVLYMSGYAEISSAGLSGTRRIDTLLKPFDAQEFLARVRETLDTRTDRASRDWP